MLKHQNPEQCPCCGKIGIIAANISSGSQTGTITGLATGAIVTTSSIGLGSSFIRGNIKLASDLQNNLREPSLENDVFSKYMRTPLIIAFIVMIYVPLADFVTRDTDKSYFFPMLLLLIVSSIGMVIISFKRYYTDGKIEEKEIEQANIRLKRYYRNIRYCDNCHLVYDAAGYSVFANENAIEKLIKNAYLNNQSQQQKRIVNKELK